MAADTGSETTAEGLHILHSSFAHKVSCRNEQ